MATFSRSSSSRRKRTQVPEKIRIVMKGSNSKILPRTDNEGDQESDPDMDGEPERSGNNIPEDPPEGTVAIEPLTGEESTPKKKKDLARVRVDTSVLDNVCCTACGRQLNPYKGNALQKHPELKVAICRRCEKFLSSGEIAKDKDGVDEQCRWCGEGGRLVVCDECACAFCKACVMRNFNRSEFNNINSQSKWKCYLCNKAPLQGLRENYRNIRDTLKALQAKDMAKAAAGGSSTGTATPTSNGTNKSGKTNGPASDASKKAGSAVSSSPCGETSNQRSKSIRDSSSSKGSQSTTVAAGAVASDEELTVSAADLDINVENVDVLMDKLSTATNTFKEMLRALRSQFHSTSPRAADEAPPLFHFSLGNTMDVLEKKRCCAKALTRGLQTYMKSFKTILSVGKSPLQHAPVQSLPVQESQSVTSDPKRSDRIPSEPVKRTQGKISVLSTPKTVNGVEKVSGRSKNIETENSLSENAAETSSVIQKDSENISSSNKDLEKANKKDLPTSKDKDLVVEDATSADTAPGSSGKVSKSKDRKGDKSHETISGDETNVRGQLRSKPDNETASKKSSDKPPSSQDLSEEVGSPEQSMGEDEIIPVTETPESGENDAQGEQSEDKNSENMAAKFDLIKELTAEMIKGSDDDEDKSGDDDELENDLPISFGVSEDPIAQDSSKSPVKRKKTDTVPPSDEGKHKKSKKTMKASEKMATSVEGGKDKGHDKESSSSSKKATKKAGKTRPENGTTEDAPVASDASSSDVLMSSDDEAQTCTQRRQRKKSCASNLERRIHDAQKHEQTEPGDFMEPNRKETTNDSEKTKGSPKGRQSHGVKDKPASVKTGGKKTSGAASESSKPKENGNGDQEEEKEENEDDDLDKEIEKLSKMPNMRKRKRKSSSGEEEVEEKEEAKSSKAAVRKSKPGPKCSKKSADFEDLSSDDNDLAAKDDEAEEEEEDEDEPKVTFFLESSEQQEDKDVTAAEENEMAKNGMLNELESEVEEDDDKDDSSSDEDMAAPKKTKKKKDVKGEKEGLKTAEASSEEEENTEENVGRPKQIRDKLLDTNLSDSDSDVGKKKSKPKKADEDDNFKATDKSSSSGSSIESDLSDENDSDPDDEDELEEEEDKPKKKGKKKSRKKRKRKGKKGADEEDEDEEDTKKKGKGKKRRRIKKMKDSSDESGEKNEDDDDDDDDDPNKSTAGKRKKIRRVMSNKKLEDSTRAAAKAEEKRRKRIAAKQREFNIETIDDENNPMNCPTTTKLVLEPGKEEGDEPIVQINTKLVRKLKPHQVDAIQFMWDCMFESVKRSKKEQGAGCILAHCMGLGKTLSVVGFVHTILSHQKVLQQKTCLVVSPLNTVFNWQNEWTMWLDEEDQLEVWELASCKQNAARADTLKEWHSSGGIMIMGYEMYRNLTMGARVKNKRQKKIFQETLVDPGPDLVVCDEGHILKNEASAISKAMNQMKTRRRVVLTGTPLQNNLNEYHCMLSFVKPNLLGTRKEFNNRFISPIQNGQCTDSTARDVKLMKARAHILHEMLAGCVQRKDYSALTKFLPPKQEYVISVRLTDIQIELYEKYLELTGQGVDGVFNNKGARMFKDYQNVMKIWTHPWVLKLAEIRDELKMKFDDEDSFIDDESANDRSFSSSGSSSDEEKKFNSDSGGEGTSAGAGQKRGTRRTRAKARRQAGEDSDPEEVIAEWKSKSRAQEPDDTPAEETDKTVTNEWWAPYVTEEDKTKLELGNKLFLLFEILRMCEEIGDKILIFSQSILSLNIIESFLETVDSKYQQEINDVADQEEEEKENFGRSWTKTLDYYRMDGSTSAQNRQAWAQSFNDVENYRARLFLISTKAGGLGINLVAANRVIIFDASWNPSHDVQSIFRVYRFGQTKPCYIYRFLAQGTMEEKIYERQVTKLSLSQRVVDEHQIERHFSASDLKELYTFRPDRWDDGTEKPTLALPKDPLLAEVLTNNKHCVVSFHEHDSLLENQIEQTLTEEEKKAAWEEYENEKKGIIMRGPGMERTASWPMMAAAQILSREQITATVQALRQQLPDIPEDIFQLHVQQALRRMVQLKQEEMRRMELMRMQEMNYLNMMKQEVQQAGYGSAQSLQAMQHGMQNMAPWMQIQRLRAMQSQMMQGGMGLSGATNAAMMGHAARSMPRISNNVEDAIDLDASPSK